ncbi:hypothetical protein V2J09_001438 [Rumex salicifolius]
MEMDFARGYGLEVHFAKEKKMPTMSLRLCSYPWRIHTNPIPLAFSQFLFSHPNISGYETPFKTHSSFPLTSYRNISSNPFRLQAMGGSGRSSPLSGLEDTFMGYIMGKKKATEVAHSVWKNVVQKGDTVVDATCGNGHDTLAMLKLVKDDDSGCGCVYGFDIQEDAINNTLSLLDRSLGPNERKRVNLNAVCHSRMLEVLPSGISVRLVAFNLGYLPGSDKTIITKSSTTLLAMEAAKEVVVPGGLISAAVYVGHSGGREEFETIQGFASGLSAEDWICTEIRTVNRPSSPILVFFFKR